MSRGSKTTPKDRQHNEETTEAAEPSGDILLMEEFVEKLGGLDRARLAIDTLEELRHAA